MVKIALARCLSYFVISSNAFLPIGLEIKPLLRFLPNLVHWFFKIYSILHAIQRFAADRHRVQTIAPIPFKFSTTGICFLFFFISNFSKQLISCTFENKACNIYSILSADRPRVQTMGLIPSKFRTLLLYINLCRQFFGFVEIFKNSHFLHYIAGSTDERPTYVLCVL